MQLRCAGAVEDVRVVHAAHSGRSGHPDAALQHSCELTFDWQRSEATAKMAALSRQAVTGNGAQWTYQRILSEQDRGHECWIVYGPILRTSNEAALSSPIRPIAALAPTALAWAALRQENPNL